MIINNILSVSLLLTSLSRGGAITTSKSLILKDTKKGNNHE